jgi:Zn ribbon nucleic-acid-binding protein
MKKYFFQNGIRKLAQEVKGEENIYLGIRPYGFHAGNMLPFVLYPILLCEEIKKLKKEPKFNFFIFINDWEQDGLAGPDIKNYPFNVYPKNTTFQYILHYKDKNKNIVDYWQPIIFKNVKKLKNLFPKVKIKAIRNSELKNNPIMKKHLLFTIKNPNVVANILKKYTNKKILKKPISYAIAVCPNCKKVKGNSHYKNKKIYHNCLNCGKKSQGNYEDFDYWFYHKPLAIPRLEIFNIDICITGLDHYNEGDFTVREKLIKAYNSTAKFPKTLYTQIVLSKDGEIMGKSRGNAKLISLEELRNCFNRNPNAKTIVI